MTLEFGSAPGSVGDISVQTSTKRNNNTLGKFISLEGLDGSGKTTHVEWLTNVLKNIGKTVVTTREPGGTPLGEKLRSMLLSDPMDIETEALLMFAARKEHISKVIWPAIIRGDWVISDRFTDSSFAFQGGGRLLNTDKLEILEQLVQGDFQPNITFLFDLPVEVAQARINKSRVLDRFEIEQFDFHERVRNMYLKRATESNGRIVIIDATKTIEEIREDLMFSITNI